MKHESVEKRIARLDPTARQEFRVWYACAVVGACGRTRKALLADARSDLKPQLTPEQWAQILAIIQALLPLILALLAM